MADGSFKDVPEFFEVRILSVQFLFLDAHNPATGRTRGVDSRQDRESLSVSSSRPLASSKTPDDRRFPQRPFVNSDLRISVML